MDSKSNDKYPHKRSKMRRYRETEEESQCKGRVTAEAGMMAAANHNDWGHQSLLRTFKGRLLDFRPLASRTVRE